MVWSGDVEWLTVNDINWECLETGVQQSTRYSGALYYRLPVCSAYVLGRQVSAIPDAASVTSRGRTCVCQ